MFIFCLIYQRTTYLTYGNLRKISAFPFESYLGIHVKGAVRSGFKPLQQISHHINIFNESPCDMNIPNNSGPQQEIHRCAHENFSGKCYKKI